MSDLRGRLDRLEARVGPPPEEPAKAEAWEREIVALNMLESLLHDHADEIEHDLQGRLARGEDYKTALAEAKHAAWRRSEEGRAALAVLGVLEGGGA